MDVGAPTLLVPRGSEERAVRRAAPNARIVSLRAGAAAGRHLPQHLDGPLILLGLCGALGSLAVGTVVVCESATDDVGMVVLSKLPALKALRVRAVDGNGLERIVTQASAKRSVGLPVRAPTSSRWRARTSLARLRGAGFRVRWSGW